MRGSVFDSVGLVFVSGSLKWSEHTSVSVNIKLTWRVIHASHFRNFVRLYGAASVRYGVPSSSGALPPHSDNCPFYCPAAVKRNERSSFGGAPAPNKLSNAYSGLVRLISKKNENHHHRPTDSDGLVRFRTDPTPDLGSAADVPDEFYFFCN